MKTDHARFGPICPNLSLSIGLVLGLSLILVGCTGDTVLSAYLETNRAKLEQPVSAEPGPPSSSSSRVSPREPSPRTWRTPG